MEPNLNKLSPGEKEYPLIVDICGNYRLLVDNKYKNGFYMEIWTIERYEGLNYSFKLMESPYKFSVMLQWERYKRR